MKVVIQSILQTLVWTLLCGVVYPIAITVIAQAAFHDKAEGSLVMKDGKLIGSALLAQQFTGTNYFWPRPSACSYGTGAAASPSSPISSSGSNLGPTSGQLQTNVMNNISAFISGNNLPTNTAVPADIVFASASGLDPHISPEAANLQVARVAASRGMSKEAVQQLVDKFTEGPQWGIFGEPRVNVLLLNVALDDAAPKKPDAAAPAKS